MMPYVSEEFGLFFFQQLLEWLMIVTACYFGARLVRVSERRSLPESRKQQLLQRRVRELEQLTEELGAQVEQLREADRFASALLLKGGATDHARKSDRMERRADERMG